MNRPDLDATDAIHAATALVRAIEMTTRDKGGNFADAGDADAIAMVCFAAIEHLALAVRLLSGKGEPT